MQTIPRRFQCFVAIVTVLAVVLPGVSLASNKSADRLIEASLYVQHAQSLESSCLADAIQWDRKALDSARHFRSNSPAQRDTSAAFIANVEVELSELGQRRTNGEQQLDETERALHAHNLRTAAIHLHATEGMSCNAKFAETVHQLQVERSEANKLVQSAETNLDSNAKLARKQLEKAGKVDAEIPGLADRIAFARQREKQQRTGHSAGAKVLGWIIVGGVIAGVSVYASSQNNQR